MALLFFPIVAHSQTPEAVTHFDQGRAAFERQDYAAALAAFEAAAVEPGMSGPAVHYNIGVAAYRMKRYDRARKAFEAVALTPAMAALAQYNLGLIARAEDNHSAAIEYFERAYQAASDERLRSLARAQLDQLNSPPAASIAPIWARFATAGMGYDDNVTLTSNDAAIGVSRDKDAYTDAQFAVTAALTPAWRFDVDTSFLNYVELNAYDQIGLGAGARYRLESSIWTTELGLQAAVTYLDGEQFEMRETLFAQTTRPLDALWSVRGRYRFSNIDAAAQYPGLDGARHEAMVRLFRASPRWAAGIQIQFEINDYSAQGISTTRQQLLADARWSVSLDWSARASVSYRGTQFDDAMLGEESRIELAAALERWLYDRWWLTVQYTFTDNRADISEFEYRRNRLFAGVEVTF